MVTRGRIQERAGVEPGGLGPEAADALHELAGEWGVDLLEAYRLVLWIEIDPTEVSERLEAASASRQVVLN